MKIQKLSDEKKIYTTCFNEGITFRASTEDIIKVFGEPDFREGVTEVESDGKVTREWDLELEDGTVLTIYDWKEYRDFDDDEVIEWHVGTNPQEKAKDKIIESLNEVGLKVKSCR
jgi:hypothetical protein